MTSITQEYNAFLDENNIEIFEDLVSILNNEPYNLEVSLSDKYNDLVLFNITENTNLDIDITRIFDSIIINLLNNEIVCFSSCFLEEIMHNEVNELLDFNLKGIVFKEITDGIYIRLFYHNNKWIVSTMTNIDANDDNIDDFTTVQNIFDIYCFKNFNYSKILNKDYTYLFSITTNTNNLQLFHVNTFDCSNFKEVKHNLPIQTIPNVKFKNVFNLLEICSYSRYTTIGFFIYDTNKNKNYKIFTDDYHHSSYLKGNETDTIKRYIRLNREGLVSEYLNYAPYENTLYKSLDITFNWYVNYFYFSYVSIHIHKQEKLEDEYIFFEKEVIQKIHDMYNETRVNISKETVKFVLRYLPTDISKELLLKSN